MEPDENTSEQTAEERDYYSVDTTPKSPEALKAESEPRYQTWAESRRALGLDHSREAHEAWAKAGHDKYLDY